MLNKVAQSEIMTAKVEPNRWFSLSHQPTNQPTTDIAIAIEIL